MKDIGIKYFFLAFLLFIGSPTLSAQGKACILFENDSYKYNDNLNTISLEDVQSSLELHRPSELELSILPNCQEATNNVDLFFTEYNPKKYGILRKLTIMNSKNNATSGIPITQEILSSITGVTQITELTFQGLTVDFSDNSFPNLKGLKELTLTKISFFGENVERLQSLILKEDEDYADLKFKKFAQDLTNLPHLEVLDLSDNEFFPHPTKGKGKKVSKYNDWCGAHVRECAELLAENYKGYTLKMSGNNLGPIFIKAFANGLENTRLIEIDFSDNSLRADEAAEFVVSVKEKVQHEIKVILFPSNFKENELNACLVVRLLDNVYIN